MSNLLKKEKGFTLIEIVLVLAIAGLLLVIVFLAVSGAQKSRRDSQRKNDNARIESQLESYAGNNNGTYPTAATQGAFVASYLTSANLNDPSTGSPYTYGFTYGSAPAAGLVVAPPNVKIYVNGRTIYTCMGLEQGTQCLNNQ